MTTPDTRLLISGERAAGDGPGFDAENPYIETVIERKSWWYPYAPE
jgi:hypothetical protein